MWTKVDKDNLPSCEVLATDGTSFHIGHLNITKIDGFSVMCCNHLDDLEDIDYYILIKDLIKTLP